MRVRNFVLGAVSVSVMTLYSPTSLRAQGVGVVVQNPQSFAQSAAQWTDKLLYLKSQLENETATLKSLTGNRSPSRLAAGMLNELQKVLPPDWEDVYNDAMKTGSSLAGSAQKINSAFGSQFSGLNSLQALQSSMSQLQAQGGYDRAMAEQAYNGIKQTYASLEEIAGQMDSVSTQKDAVDLQNRLQAAQGQVQAQNAQIQLMQMLQQAQEKLVKMQHQQAETKYAFGDLDNIETPNFTGTE